MPGMNPISKAVNAQKTQLGPEVLNLKKRCAHQQAVVFRVIQKREGLLLNDMYALIHVAIESKGYMQ